MMKADDFAMTTSSLDPFDEETTCPKCGFKQIEIAYCKGSGPVTDPFMRRLCEVQGEHLHGRCERCGYLWEMAVFDSVTTQRSFSVPRPPHPMNAGFDTNAKRCIAYLKRAIEYLGGYDDENSND